MPCHCKSFEANYQTLAWKQDKSTLHPTEFMQHTSGAQFMLNFEQFSPHSHLYCNVMYKICYFSHSLFSKNHTSTERPPFTPVSLCLPTLPILDDCFITAFWVWSVDAPVKQKTPHPSLPRPITLCFLSCITSWQCRFSFFLPVQTDVIFCCDVMEWDWILNITQSKTISAVIFLPFITWEIWNAKAIYIMINVLTKH